MKLTGTWSSPSGNLRLFNKVSNDVVIRYYTSTLSLLFQGDKGDELGNGLADKIKSFSQPAKSGNLLSGCSNSTSIAEGPIVSDLEEVHESITNFCKTNSNDLSERNLSIMYGVNNSCQTQETGEWATRDFHVCMESPCLCEQVLSDIKTLKLVLKNNSLNIILNTTGDFIKYLEIKSILKFGKVSPIITVKKYAMQ